MTAKTDRTAKQSGQDTFGPVFPGVRLPAGAYLPIEIIQALPYMSLAEMRVVMATVYHTLQFGGGESLTLSDFERLTGLARPSVVAGLKAAMRRGLMVRYPVPGYRGSTEYLYEINAYPEISGSKNEPLNELSGSNFEPLEQISGSKNEPLNPENSELSGSNFEPLNELSGSNFELGGHIKLSNAVNSNTESLLLTAAPLNLNGGEIKILNRLRNCGVYLTTAHQLVREYPAERIEAWLRIYPLAVRVYGVGPGWLVSAIKDMERTPDDVLLDLQERQQNLEEYTGTKSQNKAIPAEIQKMLSRLGWRGSLADVEQAWQEDPERVRQWLWYAKRQGWSCALLRTVLRSPGEYPPELEPGSEADNRRRRADLIKYGILDDDELEEEETEV
jgi:hypothetical protein